jgi:putative heme-binding domain-containing protein
MAPTDLARLLGDSRPAVRNRAIQELSRKGTQAMTVLEQVLRHSTSPEWRRNAVWSLTRIESAAARKAVRAALKDHDASVRLAAIHSGSVWRDAGALPRLLDLIESGSPSVQRAAAEAVGRLGNKSAVPALLAAASTQHDRVLEHSLTYALIEIADPVAAAAGLRTASPFAKRAALIALDQMDGSKLPPERVTPLLASADPVLQGTAAWIIGHHPEWGSALVGFFRERLAVKTISASERVELERQLAQSAGNQTIQELLAKTLRDPASSAESRLTALHAMAQASLKAIPGAWTNDLQAALADAQPTVVRAAIAAIRSVPAAKTNFADFSESLLRLARDPARPAELKLDALGALPSSLKRVEPELFQFLCASLNSDQPLLSRGAAATIFGKAKLNETQLLDLCDKITEAGSLELSRFLTAFQGNASEAVGLKLVAALKNSKALMSITVDSLKSVLAKFPASVQAPGAELLASLNVDAAKQKAHLDDLLGGLKDGDVRRGQAIFNSQKTACSTCHAIGYLGGNVGPDLTRIGQVRTDRDLLEAIVYPSASFVRSFEPMVVINKSGDVSSGILRKDSPDEVVLVTGPNVEVRINRSDVAEMRPGTVSVMPAGLDEQLSRQEMADLVAFLRATRW